MNNSQKKCKLCKSELAHVYDKMGDDLYGSPGEWDIYRCTNKDCEVAILDPHPTQTELTAAYSTYFTHDDVINPTGGLSRLWDNLRREYLERKFGYKKNKPTGLLAKTLSYLIYLFPGRRSNIEAGVFFLPAPNVATDADSGKPNSNNRLLEIGCGSGKLLHRMHHLGWDATGIDLDETAIQTVKAHGIDLRPGELADQNFSNGEFDVIVMNHVIEHIENPIEVLQQCFDLLKPQGKLVLFTPNIECRGLQKWGRYWRGLDAPRHLIVFNSKSLTTTVNKAGFSVLESKTTGRTRSSELKSRRIYRRLTNKAAMPEVINLLLSEITEIYECIAVKRNPLFGDELHLIARREKPD